MTHQKALQVLLRKKEKTNSLTHEMTINDHLEFKLKIMFPIYRHINVFQYSLQCKIFTNSACPTKKINNKAAIYITNKHY